jgi:hypothetical protein
MLADCQRFWITKDLLTRAFVLLFVSLHDGNVDCARLAAKGCLALGKALLAKLKVNEEEDELFATLYECQAQLCSHSPFERVYAFDRLCRCLPCPDKSDNNLPHGSDYKDLAGCVPGALQSETLRPLLSALGALLSSGAHNSFLVTWTALWNLQLGTRLTAGVDSASLLIGGLSDPDQHTKRVATCHALKRAVFLGAGPNNAVNYPLLHDLLKAAPLLIKKGAAAAESAFYCLHVLVTLKIHGLNQQLCERFGELALVTVESSRSEGREREAALLFLEALLLTRPRQCQVFLERLRNRLRELLGQLSDSLLLRQCAEVYCLLASVALIHGEAASWLHYLEEDLHASDSADPLRAALSSQQREYVLLTTVRAVGSLVHVATADKVAEWLSPFLSHSSPQVQRDVMFALTWQSCLLSLSSIYLD